MKSGAVSDSDLQIRCIHLTANSDGFVNNSITGTMIRSLYEAYNQVNLKMPYLLNLTCYDGIQSTH